VVFPYILVAWGY